MCIVYIPENVEILGHLTMWDDVAVMGLIAISGLLGSMCIVGRGSRYLSTEGNRTCRNESS